MLARPAEIRFENDGEEATRKVIRRDFTTPVELPALRKSPLGVCCRKHVTRQQEELASRSGFSPYPARMHADRDGASSSLLDRKAMVLCIQMSTFDWMQVVIHSQMPSRAKTLLSPFLGQSSMQSAP